MERCYEYWQCRQTACKAFGKDQPLNCWDLNGGQCHDAGPQRGNDQKSCQFCVYYQATRPLADLLQIFPSSAKQ